MMMEIVNYFLQLPFWELTAVFLSVAYVVLVAQNNRWCWPAAFISTLIFTVLFFDVSLLMESLLNFYYMAMAVYGWVHWHQQSKNTATLSSTDNLPSQPVIELPIAKWPAMLHLKIILILSALSLVLGYVMDNYTQADYAYLDTFTTVFAIFTTYLVTIKVLENWLYWFVINSLSVFLYLQKGLEPTAVLAMFNVVMCIVGWIKWSNIFRQQTNQDKIGQAFESS